MMRLSPREREIVDLVGRGKSYPQVGSALRISRHTVRAHVRKICAKAGTTAPNPRTVLIRLFYNGAAIAADGD